MANWMIYGANGYTGELIAREAKARGLNPILAGRNEKAIISLAKELGLNHRIFELHDQKNTINQLSDMQLVLNCAGPFSATSQQIITAFYTTGIPNIEVYIPINAKRLSILKGANYIRWFLGWGFIQTFLKKKAAEQKGHNMEQFKSQVTYVWGEATNAQGESKTVRITTANGYALTVASSLEIAEYLLNHKPKAGYKTPSQLMGVDFIKRLPAYSE